MYVNQIVGSYALLKSGGLLVPDARENTTLSRIPGASTTFSNAPLLQLFNDFLNQDFGRRRARGQTYIRPALQPFPLNFRNVIYQVGRYALLLGNFHQSGRIGAVLRTHDQD